jgi:protein phosphatase 2C family protein 2/3
MAFIEAGKYEEALKTLYLKTDEDLRAGKQALVNGPNSRSSPDAIDPNFFNEPSGCTAVSTVLTTDGRIICVRLLRERPFSLSDRLILLK